MTSAVRGGHKLSAFIRRTRQERARVPVVEVGFKDKRMAVLAAQLEFGNPSTNLPERPAFRLGVSRMRAAVREYVREAARDNIPAFIGLTDAQWRRVAIIARDTIRKAYMDFHGPGLSSRQRERKADSPYADDELIGSEGPKLIQHIHAYIEGVKIT